MSGEGQQAMSNEGQQATVVLKSSDGETFEIAAEVAAKSKALKNMMDDNCADSAIPLSKVNAKTLAQVIDYCKKLVEKPEDLKDFGAGLEKGDINTLFDLMQAANYLDIQSLMDVTCQAAADLIRDKQPEEVRKIFNIKNDFTAEEEAEIRKENAWAFEK